MDKGGRGGRGGRGMGLLARHWKDKGVLGEE